MGVNVESRREEPLKDVVFVFLPVIGYYFCSVSNEILFNSFIFSVSVCSELNFSVSALFFEKHFVDDFIKTVHVCILWCSHRHDHT